MDFERLQSFVANSWDAAAMPALLEYMTIPCESPAFDPDWEASGHLDQAAGLMAEWARAQLVSVPGANIDLVRLPGRTPMLFIEVPGDARPPVLIYGHLDKQPPMTGWTAGRSAWTPAIEDDRLFGRGGADDGYAVFGAIIAILALREQGLTHPPCRIMIEASEESGSGDLPFYIELLAHRIGQPALVIALDAGCGNYSQLWATTSLRGQVSGTLTVRVLTEGIHSGDASGIVPSPFRIVRSILGRIEDSETGEILVPGFHVDIPSDRHRQAVQAGTILGTAIYSELPFAEGVHPVTNDPSEAALNRAWRPQFAVIGVDGLPRVASAAAVMHPELVLKLSLRLPPTLDPERAAQKLRTLLEADPPYGAKVDFRQDLVSAGWHAPPLAAWLQASLEAASMDAFGQPCAFMGGGGGIPFLSMLGKRFPSTQFVATGVLGPQSNAHGPNEFLHLPTARRIIAAVARLLHDIQ